MKSMKIVLAIVVTLSLVAAFIGGVLCGRQMAVVAIKSELVWYNEFTLRSAIRDMKNGDVAKAEKAILEVADALDRMKKVHD